MSGFKVGDKVVSTQEDSPSLYIKKGSTYTVSKVRHSGCIELAEIAKPHGYRQQNFELAPQVNKFKVGDKVRCVSRSGAFGVEVGSIYTVKNPQLFASKIHKDVYCMVLLEVDSSPYDKHFELVQEDAVLTPEEVFKHLREGTKLECRQKGAPSTWSEVTNTWCVQLREICNAEWRIKPVPEIIEANGRKYKLIAE